MAVSVPRVIYAFLAVRMLRLARFELARSERLYLDGDEAFERSRERVRLAEALATRADLQLLAAMQAPSWHLHPRPSG